MLIQFLLSLKGIYFVLQGIEFFFYFLPIHPVFILGITLFIRLFLGFQLFILIHHQLKVVVIEFCFWLCSLIQG